MLALYLFIINILNLEGFITMQITVKQEALKAISSLPETATIEDMMYRLYVIEKVNKGLDDKKNGRITSHENLIKEIEKW